MIAAVVPAAGRSVRMGQPKLLMEFDGESLIHRVVTALRHGGAERIIVVTPAGAPEAAAIAAEAAGAGAELLVPDAQPAEMRDSVELGLAVLDADPRPICVLLAPGDVPGISADLVARLVDAARTHPGRIVIPTHEGHRGHPIVLPWEIALGIRDIPDDAGINVLVASHRDLVLELPVSAPGAIVDVDTPEDVERWSAAALDRCPRPHATMKVRVRLFALAKERAGRAEVELELTDSATVAALAGCLACAPAPTGRPMPECHDRSGRGICLG